MHRTAKLALDLPLLGTECPFLYQTRTIVRRRPSSRKTSPRSITTTSSRGSQGESLKDNDENSAPMSFLREKAAQVATKRKLDLGPSITSSEKDVFNNIMTLFEKPSSTKTDSHTAPVDHKDTDYKHILDLFASMPASTETLALETRERPSREAATPETPETPEPVQTGLTTFRPMQTREPMKFRTESKFSRESAIANIQGFLDEKATSSDDAADSVQDTVLALVEDTADSLTRALDSTNPRAETAMWNVAEEKIFPLIQLLNTPSPTLSSPSPTLTEPHRQDQQQQQHRHPLIPRSTPLIPLLTQAYPSLTLLLIRLYATHHPTSAYALALLPTLKSLGPTSYVLGAHTHFYNTLLLLQWTVYSSLRGVAALLDEMEANGVDFDAGTWDVLKGIEADRKRDLDGGKGERGAAWWVRREQTVWWARVGGEWIGLVRKRLEEKGLVPGEVMREGRVPGYSEGEVDDDIDEEKRGYVVTL